MYYNRCSHYMSGLPLTVLLTTYRRPDYLSLAIRSVLSQNFKNFELLILDDASNDNTEEVVKSFKDKRIVYIKNKTNHGFPYNFRQGVKLAKGKYIFLLSDDDLILRSTTFSVVYDLMEKKKVGFAQLGLLFYDNSCYCPTSIAHPTKLECLYLPPNKNIILNTIYWHFGFASGNIYRRDLLDLDDIIEDIWFSHVKPIYRLIVKKGALYIGDHFIVGKISKSGNISYLNVDINKVFHLKKQLEIYKEFDLSRKRYLRFEELHLKGIISSLIGIKYYTSNRNVFKMAKEIIRIKTSYLYSYYFWLNLILALSMPKFILQLLRNMRLKINEKLLKNIIQTIELKKNLDFIQDS